MPPTPQPRPRRRLGYPVALKILSPDISHKSDVGGVSLDLRDEGELRAGRRTRCWRACATLRPQARHHRLHGAADGARGRWRRS